MDTTIYIPQPMTLGQRDPNMHPDRISATRIPTPEDIIKEQQQEINALRQQNNEYRTALWTMGRTVTCVCAMVMEGNVYLDPQKTGIVIPLEVAQKYRNHQFTTQEAPNGNILVRVRERVPDNNVVPLREA